MTKVTEELVAQFIQLHRGGDSFRAIGAKFGVDPRTVKSRIERRKNRGTGITRKLSLRKWTYGTWKSIWECWCGFRSTYKGRYKAAR